MYVGQSSTSTVSSRSSVTESSALPCSCRGEIPRLRAQIDDTERAVDEILSIAHQSIGFWSRLKGCQACLQGRLEELLVMFDKIIGVLQATASLFQAPGTALNEPRDNPADSPCRKTTVINYQTNPATMISASSSTSSMVPPMFLGDLRLDHDQSLALLRTVCYDAFKQLASTLYEMRQIKTVPGTRLETSIGDLLYKLLNLMEPMTEDDQSHDTYVQP